jgi:hypothetical protein
MLSGHAANAWIANGFYPTKAVRNMLQAEHCER